jgi:hypothetical protein
MARKILVRESGITNFFKSFFKAKADNKESEWLQKLRKADPELADVWVDYDKSLSNSMRVQKAAMDKLGLDSSHIDDFTKKYGIK